MTAAARAHPAGPLPEAAAGVLGPGRRVVVTGCAGFIGSHLSEALLDLGCAVTGVDALTDYYDPALKRENLAACLAHPAFTFIEANLLAVDAVALLAGATACFHLAAQAGVRASWGRYFDEYVDRNVRVTQRLLEACLDPAVRAGLARLVYSSSSSVYGDRTDLPVSETALPQPHSPYGVTKLAAEHLCHLYAANEGVPVTSLRYFTVYGPRQRPDMAFRLLLECAAAGRPFVVHGDGRQTRDFTYVSDAVRANLLAAGERGPAAVYNVGGGRRVALREALDALGARLAAAVPGLRPALETRERARGDVRDTFADCTRIEAALGWRPAVSFEAGLDRQVAWFAERRLAHG